MTVHLGFRWHWETVKGIKMCINPDETTTSLILMPFFVLYKTLLSFLSCGPLTLIYVSKHKFLVTFKKRLAPVCW